MQFVFVALASLVYIFAKAFQQLNVVHGYEKAVPLTTAAMAGCEIGVIGNIALVTVQGAWLDIGLTFVAMTAGSTAGAIMAMRFHGRMRALVEGRNR